MVIRDGQMSRYEKTFSLMCDNPAFPRYIKGANWAIRVDRFDYDPKYMDDLAAKLGLPLTSYCLK